MITGLLNRLPACVAQSASITLREGVVGTGALGMYIIGAHMVLQGRLEPGKLQGLQMIATSVLPAMLQFLYSSYRMVQAAYRESRAFSLGLQTFKPLSPRPPYK